MTNHRRVLEAEARSWGATDFVLEHGSKHPVLAFTFQGRTVRVPFSGTPRRDPGKVHIEMARLRRAMGVERHAERSGCRRRRNVAPEPEIVAPRLTILPDPFEPLAAIRERVELDCRCRMSGIDGTLGRIERRGLVACERIRAYAAEIVGGRR